MAIPGWQDPDSVQQRAYQNWQTRINTPKGNPNAPQTFMNNAGHVSYNIQNQYQMYYRQCLQCGQTPMSPMQYMQMMQQGIDPMSTFSAATDPLVTMQTGIQAGKSLAETIMNMVGLTKSNKSTAAAKPTEAQQTLMSNYQTALQNGTEFKVDNLKDFVNAQFAGMKATGDTVTTEQYSKYLEELGFDNLEATTISKVIDMEGNNGNSDNTISKKELTNFYKTAIGNDKKLSSKNLEQALETILDKSENEPDEITQAMEAKGYSEETRTINGEVTLAFVKGDEVIPCTDTDKLLQILDGE